MTAVVPSLVASVLEWRLVPKGPFIFLAKGQKNPVKLLQGDQESKERPMIDRCYPLLNISYVSTPESPKIPWVIIQYCIIPPQVSISV